MDDNNLSMSSRVMVILLLEGIGVMRVAVRTALAVAFVISEFINKGKGGEKPIHLNISIPSNA